MLSRLKLLSSVNIAFTIIYYISNCLNYNQIYERPTALSQNEIGFDPATDVCAHIKNFTKIDYTANSFANTTVLQTQLAVQNPANKVRTD